MSVLDNVVPHGMLMNLTKNELDHYALCTVCCKTSGNKSDVTARLRKGGLCWKDIKEHHVKIIASKNDIGYRPSDNCEEIVKKIMGVNDVADVALQEPGSLQVGFVNGGATGAQTPEQHFHLHYHGTSSSENNFPHFSKANNSVTAQPMSLLPPRATTSPPSALAFQQGAGSQQLAEPQLMIASPTGLGGGYSQYQSMVATPAVPARGTFLHAVETFIYSYNMKSQVASDYKLRPEDATLEHYTSPCASPTRVVGHKNVLGYIYSNLWGFKLDVDTSCVKAPTDTQVDLDGFFTKLAGANQTARTQAKFVFEGSYDIGFQWRIKKIQLLCLSLP